MVTHSDLENNIYFNPDEVEGNGLDDDGNGYIDDVHGWDFANDDASVYDSEELDLHGTYVSGIIAASEKTKRNCRCGTVNVKIMPLKFINGSTGYTCDAIEAIEYAMNMGTKALSIAALAALMITKHSKMRCKIAVYYFVTAAGNRGGDVKTLPVYPVAFDLNNVISVTAIDTMGVLPNFSSYGDSVDIAAPGTNVISTTPNMATIILEGISVSPLRNRGSRFTIKYSTKCINQYHKSTNIKQCAPMYRT